MRINGKLYSKDMKELHYLHDINQLKYIDKVMFKINGNWTETTYGRLIIWELTDGLLVNEPLGKSGVKKVVIYINNHFEKNEALRRLKKLQDLGFKVATESGISLKYEDFIIPEYTDTITPLQNNLIKDENLSKIDRLKQIDAEINKKVQDWKDGIDKNNALYLMYKSGARVTDPQIRQILIAKGLLSEMDGSISSVAVAGSLGRGLNGFDYFRTCGPARRGMANNFFVVPASGYFTRQLVSTARDLQVVEDDCGDTDGIEVEIKYARGKYLVESGEVVTKEMIEADPDQKVRIRSALTCKCTKLGLCKKCVGNNPATGKTFYTGFGIGTAAAQHLSEPATQLGLRGKHCYLSSDTFLDVNFREIRYKDAYKAVNNGHKIYTFSINPETGKFEVVRVKKVWKERYDNKYVKVTFDNGKSVRCTLDHPLMLRNGSLIEASKLKAGMSMMPIYEAELTSKGYRTIRHNDIDKSVDVVYNLSSSHYDCLNITDDLNSPNPVHHKDFRKVNDYPNNLVKCSEPQHLDFHSKRNSFLYKMGLISKWFGGFNEESLKVVAEHNREDWRRELSGNTISSWIENNREKHLEYARKGLESQQKLMREDPTWKSESMKKVMYSKCLATVQRHINDKNFDLDYSYGTGYPGIQFVLDNYPELVPDEYPWEHKSSWYCNLTKQEKQNLAFYDKYIKIILDEGLPLTFQSLIKVESRYEKSYKPSYHTDWISKYRDTSILGTNWYHELPADYFWTRREKQAFSRYKKVWEISNKLGWELTEDKYDEISTSIYPPKTSNRYYKSVMNDLPSNYMEMICPSAYNESRVNHKVVSVEIIDLPVDVPFYGIEVEGDWKNYPSGAGVISHNTSGAVNLDEYEHGIANALLDIIHSFGGISSSFMPASYSTSYTIHDFMKEYNDPIKSAAELSKYIYNLYRNGGINVSFIWPEIVLRACTDQVKKSDGTIGLRSHGDKGKIIITNVNRSAVTYPSWLKSLGFGYVKQRLIKAASSMEVSNGCLTEQIISTKLNHYFENK